MTDAYKQALDLAKNEVDELTREQVQITERNTEIDKRIVELRQSIAALSKLAGEPFDENAALGLTEAIRQVVVSTAGNQFTADDVRRILESRGFSTARYGNLLASVITILKRLRDKGEIKDQGEINGKAAYVWIDRFAKPKHQFKR